MTEQPPSSPSDELQPEATPAVNSPSPYPSRRNPVPWLYGIGFIILAVAIIYLWQNTTSPAEVTASATELRSLDQRVAELAGHINQLEQRPVPDIGKITSRLDEVGARIVSQTQLAGRLDDLSGRIEAASTRSQTSLDAVKQQLDAVTHRISAAESATSGFESLTGRLSQLVRLQQISFALSSGRPLGDLPNGPEALERYAHIKPPTEADLRLRFRSAEQAMLASVPSGQANVPFADRIWERAQGLVTVRRGDDVVVGNSSSTVLNQARAFLDAGDLSDAVGAVETLRVQPGSAMADWLAQAKALLEARSSLAALADKL